MGANEYTPDTEQVREQYTREQPPHIGTVSQKRSELDRWLEQIKREAKAEGLREAIKEVRWVYEMHCPVKPAEDYIHPAARVAHKWWEKVLGGKLQDLERRAKQVKEGR